MRIEIDFEFTQDGDKFGAHTVDTHDLGVKKTLRALASGDTDHVTAGWAVISKHPDYVGFTRFEVLKAEVIRHNDPDGREALDL